MPANLDRTTPTGQIINSYLAAPSSAENPLSDHAIHLLFAANRWEVIDTLKSHIMAGINVVVDRYSFSGAVYSAAKERPGLDLSWAWSPEVGLPAPDIVVYLTLSTEIAEKRGGWGAERYEDKRMQEQGRD